ncbi:NUDIX domain-containing protein [Oryzifoliimicrobium ureilyticus]|uniref:NUDIX domain-containing protein n=1 Tax=Oryzifoliimicrobium ureilyticus TaxID=3113724 RepID=UPI0030766ACF
MGKPGIDFPGLGVGMVILNQRRVLLYRRLNAPEAGFWNIVGGKVDLMEPASDAARREAQEETGLQIREVQFLGVSEQQLVDDRQHWVSMLYPANDYRGEPSLTEPDKLSDFGWFAKHELPQPLSVFAKAALGLLSSELF